MSYLNTMAVPDRLTGSTLPVEMFGNSAQSNPAELRLEAEQEEQDSEYRLISPWNKGGRW